MENSLKLAAPEAGRKTHVPSRILMTADTVGGVWHYSMDLAGALAEQGAEVTIAAMGGLMSEDQRSAADRPGVRVVDSQFRLEWMKDPWDDVRRAGDWLLDLAAGVRPDVIHLNNYAHGALPWGRPVVMVGHSCVFSWFAAVRKQPPPPSWLPYRQAVAAGLAAADAVTAPTHAMLDALRRHYGGFRAVRPIRNGRARGSFTPGPKDPVIFSAGRAWDAAKNLAALDEVAADIPWPVRIAGSPDHPDGGKIEFNSAGVLGHLGRADMAHWMRRAAIYALPARYEPFGLSALEAGLCRCALVLGNISSLREVWEDAAVYVDPNDPVELKAALMRLIGDDDFRGTVGARAEARARSFTLTSMVANYSALYAAVLSAHAQTAQPSVGSRRRRRTGRPAAASSADLAL